MTVNLTVGAAALGIMLAVALPSFVSLVVILLAYQNILTQKDAIVGIGVWMTTLSLGVSYSIALGWNSTMPSGGAGLFLFLGGVCGIICVGGTAAWMFHSLYEAYYRYGFRVLRS